MWLWNREELSRGDVAAGLRMRHRRRQRERLCAPMRGKSETAASGMGWTVALAGLCSSSIAQEEVFTKIHSHHARLAVTNSIPLPIPEGARIHVRERQLALCGLPSKWREAANVQLKLQGRVFLGR